MGDKRNYEAVVRQPGGDLAGTLVVPCPAATATEARLECARRYLGHEVLRVDVDGAVAWQAGAGFWTGAVWSEEETAIAAPAAAQDEPDDRAAVSAVAESGPAAEPEVPRRDELGAATSRWNAERLVLMVELGEPGKPGVLENLEAGDEPAALKECAARWPDQTVLALWAEVWRAGFDPIALSQREGGEPQ